VADFRIGSRKEKKGFGTFHLPCGRHLHGKEISLTIIEEKKKRGKTQVHAARR